MNLKEFFNAKLGKITLPDKKSMPLSAESALAMTASSSRFGAPTIEEQIIKFEESIQETIKDTTKNSRSLYLTFYFETWMTSAQKERIVNNLTELHYNVLYHDDMIMLLSWRAFD